MRKFLTMLLALTMLLSLLVGCNSGKKADATDTDSESKIPEESNPAESETQNIYDEIGLTDGLNFQDQEINIVGWNAGQPEFDVDKDSLDGDPILDAIYKRNLYTEQLLGAKLNYTIVDGNGNDDQIKIWCDTVSNMMEDPATPVDIFACYSRTAAVAMVNGLSQDITQYENLDLSKSWWPKNIQEEFEIGDKLYFLTGDISTNVLHMMFCVFYNNTLTSQYGLDNPVELVRNREWTIDKWITMTSDIYQDVDGEVGKSAGDFFGVASQYFQLDPIIQGSGFKMVEAVTSTPGEYLKVTDDFYSEKFGNFVDKLAAWSASDGFYNDGEYKGIAEGSFLEGKVIFTVQHAAYGFDVQSTDIDYGIVPPPMLDPSVQDHYTTSLANPYTIYSIARNAKDGEKAAAALQTLGFYAKENTTPAIFDVTFKGKFSKKEEVAEMFNLVRESVGFDLGILYMKKLAYICDYPTHEAILPNRPWKVVMSPLVSKVIDKKMNILNKDIDKVLNAN